MIIPEECGWIRDRTTNKLFIFLPEDALYEPDVLDKLIKILIATHPDHDQDDDKVH